MVKYQHFLLTRFNLLFRRSDRKNWAEVVEQKSRRCHNNGHWLEKRMELFELYCVPSVKGQTNQDFKWAVLINEETPHSFIEALATTLPDNATIINGKGHPHDYELAAHYMKTFVDEDTDMVISTSLDSDDAISRKFLEVVRKEAEKEAKRCYIDLVKGVVVAHHRGFQYVGEREGRTVSHFRSLVEPADNIKSVYAVSHGESHKDAPVVSVVTDERWLEVIHGDNASNRFKRKRNDKTRPLEELAEMFNIDKNKVKNPYALINGYCQDLTWGGGI